jgi:glycyl-tRNA synthetase beta chain
VEAKNFLFEIGTEEIPAAYITPAIQKIEEIFKNALNEFKLEYKEIRTYSSPRRLSIYVNQLQAAQKDEIIEKVGPAKKIAFDESGKLTKPGMGFLQGAGASESAVFIKETPKGEYIAVKVEIKGKNTCELLPVIMKNCLEKTAFPKSMRWGSMDFAFARPIRWIISLWNEEIIDFEFCGIKSGNISQGNRFSKIINEIKINSADSYLEDLKTVHVIADREVRKRMIQDQMGEIMSASNFVIQEDLRLLDQVADLVEYPNAVVASYDAKYLRLPEKIITSTLTQNQKYFSVLDNNKNLSNYFVFISNGNPEYSEIIRIGNEKVVKARLEDAEFYYNEDSKKRLDSYVSKLAEVVFQTKLGTLLEKTNRIKEIANYLCEKLDLDVENKQKIIRAAHLSKADLVTLMLGEKEFTKLQGYIGMKYALLNGEDQDVANAIYEHYMPRGQNDNLPSTLCSAVVAIADKIDTLCGIIGVDLIPTGSNDPFALRRAANGVVQIIEEYKLNLNINELIDFCFELLKSKLSEPGHNLETVYDFMKQRVRWLMETNGFEYDVIDSMGHFRWDNLLEIKARLTDISSFKSNEEFIKLVLGFKRVSNIIEKQKNIGSVSEDLLREEAEKNLFEQYCLLKNRIDGLLREMNYTKALEQLLPFNKHIDNFFDKVLVNCEDTEIRDNRYALLSGIRSLFLNISDLSKIVIES